MDKETRLIDDTGAIYTAIPKGELIIIASEKFPEIVCEYSKNFIDTILGTKYLKELK